MKQYLILLICILLSNSVLAYKMEVNTETHQHITKESIYIWMLLPYEIYNHSTNLINTSYADIHSDGYDNHDDIIDGSAEEDQVGFAPFRYHFFDPDDPDNGDYNHGMEPNSYSSLGCIGNECDSSWTRAKDFWENKVIYYYLHGDIAQSYYWLGRVSHLLEDSTVPAHMHLDPHPISDAVEEYTGSNFSYYHGV